MASLLDLFQRKPYLAWYVKDKESMSEKSIVEHVLNYGDWEDVQEAEKILGTTKMSELFDQIKSTKRVNLRPKTVNYFENYFAKYA